MKGGDGFELPFRTFIITRRGIAVKEVLIFQTTHRSFKIYFYILKLILKSDF